MSSTSFARQSHEDNGEPGCQTSEEFNKMFRNFWDPTTYWVCENNGKPAQLRRCPPSQLFYDKVGKCVHYTEWQVTPPVQPPSRPKST